jgi:hypothetical protein
MPGRPTAGTLDEGEGRCAGGGRISAELGNGRRDTRNRDGRRRRPVDLHESGLLGDDRDRVSDARLRADPRRRVGAMAAVLTRQSRGGARQTEEQQQRRHDRGHPAKGGPAHSRSDVPGHFPRFPRDVTRSSGPVNDGSVPSSAETSSSHAVLVATRSDRTPVTGGGTAAEAPGSQMTSDGDAAFDVPYLSPAHRSVSALVDHARDADMGAQI